MASKLSGKVAVVTGASKDSGQELPANWLPKSFGGREYSTSRSGADKVVSDITSKSGKAIAVQADVSKLLM